MSFNSIENRCRKVLQSITDAVQNEPSNAHELGLFGGLAGRLLFLVYAKKHVPSLVNKKAFEDKLNFLQDNMHLAITNIHLTNGMPGIGWFIELINQLQDNEYDPELCDDIDALLNRVLLQENWLGEIEMVQGISGLSVYFSRRAKHTDQAIPMRLFVNHMENLSSQTSHGTLSWLQPAHSKYRINQDNRDLPEVNLGLAHGIVGIIAALLPALKVGSLSLKTTKLLKQGCDWLLQQEFNNPDRISCFPSISNADYPSRLGWCYGDLTIALTLARVGKAIHEADYLEKAREIALHAAARDERSGQVNDAGLCHGTAGISLLFHLLNKELSHDTLTLATRMWLEKTLKLFEQNGLAGLHKYFGLEKKHGECIDFLEGYAGVGLSMLAILYDDISWTDSLLLS